uniref:Fibronectin type-III domain-containing protein n=1 Tax=Candidatus Kentrum sp. TC TaxID=2126339 RepID=A0A450YL87_9GAMM|nr:MAG: hypothetical protein BECKTC1821E_GA0114239_101819 [Candidatus Kentron sp. TC]
MPRVRATAGLPWAYRKNENFVEPARVSKPTPFGLLARSANMHIRKQPDEGGKAAYRVQRREGDSETWLDAGLAMGLETTLTNQPRGIRLEFRVVAVNKAGEGEPSNGVLAVL